MSVLVSIVKQIGFAGCVILALLAYYEGLPIVREIPFVDRVPFLRDVIVGRVKTERAKAAEAAIEGYVQRSKLAAANALLAKANEEALLATRKAREAEAQAKAARIAEKQANERLEDAIAKDTGDDGCTWSDGDLEWLRNH
ncbi:hypothetical protein [Sinorhizobium sp. BG8]|uniref:hypothetical protein n=1 Tax=Sinorhizobium sp. BG8 TaxID=2613773 RepID=UPI00193E278D|nr:hypothetical protein [Sinorhizobium sp. BG8]QRM55165.1 hypothetical protein F3Y30_11925 [Sinorhizobium sp. BG8]